MKDQFEEGAAFPETQWHAEPSTSSAPPGPSASAADKAKQAASAALAYVVRGPLVLSIFCLMGGLATMGTSLYSLIEIKGWSDAGSRPVAILMYCYHLLFGIFVVFLEAEPNHFRNCKCCDGCRPGCINCRSAILVNFMFAVAPFGRGLWYFFVGSFGVIQWELGPIISGFWMILGGAILLFAQCCEKKKSNEADASASAV
eukprot:GGOE01012923.1.p1 GENE.GGOE01012923.1~~GGOE01012923.1.p1  ORF type:complete len:209 (-),score=48.24 GGOE01012923.1:1017-1619(-)